MARTTTTAKSTGRSAANTRPATNSRATGGRASVGFGEGVGKAMRDKGISYRALAEQTGLSAGYLNHLVHGNRPVPSNEVIESIAKAVGKRPTEFREYRIRRIADALRRKPDVVDRLYKELVR
jgi:transcriptional regulator with XRE-family HTH domain